ncbi:nitrous oxide-stimulated promoter family protein [Shewanella sp. NIFS-20-20]|uniref:nitrous oxide-stimulated promoter family protein n=1 Tax=Shewanella sp. NIFS-20-20 TaxID=2853806 RepID=UPI001C4625BF|nr:nitrous oxide-stimulated promoter family protein [Shewanella sp. NIFS-20-20]MBV7315654.1 nitrous oxide-stimulated promoter family protein [Shewanella sp. NIFS-20-20]
MTELIQFHGPLLNEFKTLSAMIAIYCRHQHGGDHLCGDCQSLLEYANMRLDRCPYGTTKPTCNKCPVHCYKPGPKAMMRDVMIFAGPRMLIHHPLLALKHLMKERQSVPALPPKGASNRHQRQS